MAAVAGSPGLSSLLAWPTDHLTEAAAHWEDVGERSYGVAHGVWSDALGADWSGEAADALRADTHADMLTTSGVVDQLQEAASVARSGASELEAARSQVRYAVDDARSAGYQVGEDLSITDRMASGSAAQMAARQAAAEAHAANIGARAAQLVSVDAQVASRVTAAVADVRSTFPPAPPSNGQVHAVDSHTFKQDPAMPVDPKDMTAAEARAAMAAVNSEIDAWNARCDVNRVGQLPPAQYSACMADRGPLVARQAAIRDRLRQLGIPVDGGGPATPSGPNGNAGEPAIPPNVQVTLNQIVAGKWPGSANAPGTEGGSSFENREGLLPAIDSSGRPITYQEWDVNPKVPGQDRDAQRIVTVVTVQPGIPMGITDHSGVIR